MGVRRWLGAGVVGLLVVGGAGLVASGATAPSEPALAGWPRQLGTAGAEYPRSTAVSGSGDVYAVGLTDGAFPGYTNAGTYDAFVAKYDKNGNQKWVRQFGTSENDAIDGVAVAASGDVYVSGVTGGVLPGQSSAGLNDLFVAKYDKNGNQKWVRQYGGPDREYGQAVAVSRTGDVYVFGGTDGALPGQSSAGNSDLLLIKYDKNGNRKWVRQYGTDRQELTGALAVSRTGEVYLTASTLGAVPGFVSAGNFDAVVVKYDKNGNQKWATQFGGSDTDFAGGPAVSASGEVYVSGLTEGALPGQTSAGSADAFVAKFDKNGTQTWLRQFGTDQYDACSGGPGVAVSGSSVYVSADTCGAFDGFALQGDTDAVLAKYDGNGNQQWVRQYGTGGSDASYGIAIRSSNSNGGAIVTIGQTCGGTVWGQVRYGISSDCDVFVATFPK